MEHVAGTASEQEGWTTGAAHDRMTLVDELGGPFIGATNENPRLRKQPGFSSGHLRDFILANLAVPERAPDDDIQIQPRLRR